MHVPHGLATRLHVVVDGVRRDGADFHQAVVLDEDRVAREVPMHDGRHAAVEVAIIVIYKLLATIEFTSADEEFD